MSEICEIDYVYLVIQDEDVSITGRRVTKDFINLEIFKQHGVDLATLQAGDLVLPNITISCHKQDDDRSIRITMITASKIFIWNCYPRPSTVYKFNVDAYLQCDPNMDTSSFYSRSVTRVKPSKVFSCDEKEIETNKLPPNVTHLTLHNNDDNLIDKPVVAKTINNQIIEAIKANNIEDYDRWMERIKSLGEN